MAVARLEARHIQKSYGTTVAVGGISFALEPGRVLGLLGPNGAGKTTAVSILAGVVSPDGGEVLLDGHPLRSDADPLKRSIGLVPQEITLFEELGAAENLRYYGGLYGLSGGALRAAVDAGLALAGLSERARDKVRTFSGGMKRRLNLAAGIVHSPAVLLLDEPTEGVDPQSRNALFETFASLKASGMAILHTTHHLEEAERLCDRVVIVDHGRVVAEGTPRELQRILPAARKLVVGLGAGMGAPWIEELRAQPFVSRAEADGDTVSVHVREFSEGAPALLSWLATRGVRCESVQTEGADLEAAFLALTGKELRDA